MPRLLSRSDWGARPDSVDSQGKMPGAVSKIWAHHSVTPISERAKKAAKRLESIGMTRFGVFSYSFAIHRSGTIIEGCGWDFIGAHTAGQNSTSYGFVFIGNYETDELDPRQIDSFQWLIAEGKRRGKITASPTIDGHQKASGAATACPGRNVMAKLPELREPFREKKSWLVRGVKKRRRVVKGHKRARTVRAAWKTLGYDVTITEQK
jgi:hypothetical protein